MLRFLEDYYASPFRRLVTPVPVTEEQSTLLSLPESADAVLVNDDSNVIDGLAELEIDNIKKRLRSKGEGCVRKGGGGGGGR